MPTYSPDTARQSVQAPMCNDRSWKSCSMVTIVFTSMLMLGMIIAIGVMNSMFGDNMQVLGLEFGFRVGDWVMQRLGRGLG